MTSGNVTAPNIVALQAEMGLLRAQVSELTRQLSAGPGENRVACLQFTCAGCQLLDIA